MLRLLLALTAAVLFALTPSSISANGAEYEQRVVELVNQIRQESGLSPLAVSPELTASARRYAEYMATARFFGHQGPDGSTLVTRNEAAGYRDWTYLAENLAGGHSDPRAVIRGWMESPSHRANVLSPSVREIGVGYVYRPGSIYGHYWAQEFGARQGRPQPMAAQVSSANQVPTSRPPVLGASTSPQDSSPPAELRDPFGSLDTLGYPRSGVVRDPATGQWVQYYQRAVLEWHPENPPTYRVQRRLLGDLLYPGAQPPTLATDPPPGPHHHFPLSSDRPTGLGHFVADYTRDGRPIYFKQFFDAHGGVQTFGYPKEEPQLRNGRWTQRFQAAVFEYHPEFDRDGCLPGTTTPYRAYRVQLELLGDKYIQQRGLPAGS